MFVIQSSLIWQARAARWAPWVALLALLVMLVAGMMVPVYSDEVGWRLQERAGIDGVDKLYSEQCGPGTLAVAPWFMMPVRWYSAYFNLALPDPFWVRASGVAYALVLVALMLALVWASARGNARRPLATLALGLLGLGTLPWLLVWSRPEQPIVLAALGSLLLALARGNWRRRLGPPLVLALATVALAYHFKALVLLPLFLACVAACGPVRRDWLWRLINMALMLAMTAVAARYWFARMACPGDAVLAAQHARQSLSLQVLAGSQGWLGAGLRLLGNYNLAAYVSLAAPNATPMSNWVLPGLVGKLGHVIWVAALILGWFGALGMAIWAVVDAARRRLKDVRPWLALVLFGCLSVWCVGQIVHNTYEAGFMLPLLAAVGVLALGTPGLPAPLGRAVAGLAGALALAVPLSAAALLVIYGPSLARAAGTPGYLPGQPYSQGLRAYPAARIAQAAAACGITPASHPRRLLIDDVTYFAFMAAPLPDHQISVIEPQWRGAVTDPLAYLKARHSSGMVLGCQHLPPELRAKARASGEFCCIGPAQW